MLRRTLRSLWNEPAIPDPPRRVWRDWVLVAVVVVAAIVEVLVNDELVWPVPSLLVCLGLVPTVLWRRTQPLAMVVTAFGVIALVNVVAIVQDVKWSGLAATAYVLVLIYSLSRWGSGRAELIGLLVIWGGAILGSISGNGTVGELVGGIVIVTLAAALGGLVRYEETSRRRGLSEARLHEREQLARELHDTVAHHVSAIAVQAQAGRTLASSRPDVALDALAVIEEEASRTLDEMRNMVGALRQGEEPDLAPQQGVADIERLATASANGGAASGPRVDVALEGDLDDLGPSVDAALYRLAQESITNAVRHAKRASRIDVRVVGGVGSVRLTVHDDGEPASADGGATHGFGLVGMSERAKLLGGTLRVGPNPDRGWTVDAVLPRRGSGS